MQKKTTALARRLGTPVLECFLAFYRLVVKKRVADRDIRDLIWKFLRAGVLYNGKFAETLTGTPQGGIASPLFANIYLHALDTYMESNYLNLGDYARARRRKQGKSNYLYVRYADGTPVQA